jgi:hypothetical protein
MNTFDWGSLSGLQLGRYAEYLVKMELTNLGFSVFSAEVDDRGIDFVVRSKTAKHYDLQVKSSRHLNYVFIQEDKLPEEHNFYLALVLFLDEGPRLYLIPGPVMREPSPLFKQRRFDRPGQKSKPEFGLNLSEKNLSLLQPYVFSDAAKKLV